MDLMESSAEKESGSRGSSRRAICPHSSSSSIGALTLRQRLSLGNFSDYRIVAESFG